MARTSYKLEFMLKASPTILWDFLTTSTGLANWLAESVDEDEGVYTFDWSGSKEQARMVESEPLVRLRLQWLDGPDDEYFEFSIASGEVTGDTILYVTDFADEDDVENQTRLWESQVASLIQRSGG